MALSESVIDLAWLNARRERLTKELEELEVVEQASLEQADRIAELEASLAMVETIMDYEHLFEMQRARVERATRVWQQLTGEVNTIPDLGRLVDFLLRRYNRAVREAAMLREKTA